MFPTHTRLRRVLRMAGSQILRRALQKVGNQPAPYRGLSGPPGPKFRKSLENVSRRFRPGDPKRSPKSLGDSRGSLRRVSGECLESLFELSPRLFGDFFGVPGRRPRRQFRDFLGISGPEGPRDPRKGRAGSQKTEGFLAVLWWKRALRRGSSKRGSRRCLECDLSRKRASLLRFGLRQGHWRQQIVAICDCDFWCSRLIT